MNNPIKNYFRKTKKDQFDAYQKENKIAKQILGERDYASINRIFKWLKYESVGEFIYYEKLDWPKIFIRYSYYDQSTFISKNYRFLSPTIPKFRIYKLLYYSLRFSALLVDLRKGLIDELFEEEDYNTLVNYYNNFRSFLANRGQRSQHLQMYIIQAEALLEKKRQQHQTAPINTENVSPVEQNSLMDKEQLKPISEEYIVPFPPFKPNFLPKIDSCLMSMERIGLIMSAKEAIVPFIQPGKNIFEKVIWNGELVSLVFFIEYLIFRSKSPRSRRVPSLISLFFSTSSTDSLNTNTISNYSTYMGFSQRDPDHRKLKVTEWIRKNKNTEIRQIKSIVDQEF